MPTITPDSPANTVNPIAPETVVDGGELTEQSNAGTDSELDEGRFRTLLRRWNRHQDLRRDGADVASLSRSREVLDAAREALRSAPYGRGA